MSNENVINMHFNKNDKDLFNKYLNNAQYYFEFGSGGSTYHSSIKQNIKQLYSVESDKEWFDKMIKLIYNKDKLNYFFIDIDAISNNWGYPGKNCSKDAMIKYSDCIRQISSDMALQLNVILIDGRFRVACCLKCFDVINDDCVILFDDFLNRPHYHIVLNYYDIVEKTTDNRMVALKKKKNINGPGLNVIKKYEIISQ